MDPIDNYFSKETKPEKATSLARCLKLLENNEELKDLFAFNLMTNAIEFYRAPMWNPDVKTRTEIEDNDIVSLRAFLTRRYNFSPTKDNLFDSMLDIAKMKRYHPIKDYLNGLVWDCIPRLDNWLTAVCGVVENTYTQAVGRKIMVAAVARINDPGIKFDYLTILEGRQAAKKSMLIERMAIDKRNYTTINFSQTDKEITENISGKWIVEVPEMHGFKRQEVERTKALLSRSTDRTRLAYGRIARDFPRKSILIGTLNPKGDNRYLADETGNRRYWPVICADKIDIDLFMEIRDQLYAEAMTCYKRGEALWLDNENVEQKAVEEQAARQTVDPWIEIVESWLAIESGKHDPSVSIVDIAQSALKIPPERINSPITSRIGKILINARWRKIISNGSRSVYGPPKIIMVPIAPAENEW